MVGRLSCPHLLLTYTEVTVVVAMHELPYDLDKICFNSDLSFYYGLDWGASPSMNEEFYLLTARQQGRELWALANAHRAVVIKAFSGGREC